MTVYERLASTDDGQRRLSRARLRYAVLKALHQSLEESKLNKADVSRRLGIRKSAVGQVFSGDGNLRVNTMADYFDAMGFEVELQVVPKGRPRAKADGTLPRLDLIHSQARPMKPITEGGRLRPETVRPWHREPMPTANHG